MAQLHHHHNLHCCIADENSAALLTSPARSQPKPHKLISNFDQTTAIPIRKSHTTFPSSSPQLPAATAGRKGEHGCFQCLCEQPTRLLLAQIPITHPSQVTGQDSSRPNRRFCSHLHAFSPRRRHLTDLTNQSLSLSLASHLQYPALAVPFSNPWRQDACLANISQCSAGDWELKATSTEWSELGRDNPRF